MAKTTPKDYIKDKVVRLRAMVGANGKNVFQRVGRTAAIDLERLRQIPAFPVAFITQLDGTLSDTNDEIWDRAMAITIVTKAANDPFADYALEQLDDLSERLIDELQSDRQDDGIICTYMSEDQLDVESGGSLLIAWKTLRFEYSIDRTTPTA